MAKVSISEAARLAGVSRQHLYKKYLATGLLSVEKDGEHPPMCDTSELLRVFGELKGEGKVAASPSGEGALLAEIENLRRWLAERDTQLQEAREREAWLKQHVDEITSSPRLLEDKDKDKEELQGQLKKTRAVLQQYKIALEAERKKGFWARVFRR